MRMLLVVAGLGFFVGCAASAGNLKFKSFGTYRPEFEQSVADGYQNDKSQGPGESEVTIYSATLPAGVTVKDGVISATPGSERVVLGTFNWTQGALAPAEKDSAREFGKIAIAAGGNEIVLLEVKADRGYVRSATGYVLRFAPASKLPPEEATKI